MELCYGMKCPATSHFNAQSFAVLSIMCEHKYIAIGGISQHAPLAFSFSQCMRFDQMACTSQVCRAIHPFFFLCAFPLEWWKEL